MGDLIKVALYARVSKDEMSSSGAWQDPENQLKPLREFCIAMKWEITDTFIDKCSGGIADRPEFKRMMNKVKQKCYNIVLVWALDRFSREGMTNTLSYIQTLKSYKTGLKSLQESWLDTTQEGISEVVLAFMAWVAQQEKKRISERTKAGLAKKKSEGKILGRPKGWRKSKIEGIKSPSYKQLLKEGGK